MPYGSEEFNQTRLREAQPYDTNRDYLPQMERATDRSIDNINRQSEETAASIRERGQLWADGMKGTAQGYMQGAEFADKRRESAEMSQARVKDLEVRGLQAEEARATMDENRKNSQILDSVGPDGRSTRQRRSDASLSTEEGNAALTAANTKVAELQPEVLRSGIEAQKAATLAQKTSMDLTRQQIALTAENIRNGRTDRAVENAGAALAAVAQMEEQAKMTQPTPENPRAREQALAQVASVRQQVENGLRNAGADDNMILAARGAGSTRANSSATSAQLGFNAANPTIQSSIDQLNANFNKLSQVTADANAVASAGLVGAKADIQTAKLQASLRDGGYVKEADYIDGGIGGLAGDLGGFTTKSQRAAFSLKAVGDDLERQVGDLERQVEGMPSVPAGIGMAVSNLKKRVADIRIAEGKLGGKGAGKVRLDQPGQTYTGPDAAGFLTGSGNKPPPQQVPEAAPLNISFKGADGQTTKTPPRAATPTFRGN